MPDRFWSFGAWIAALFGGWLRRPRVETVAEVVRRTTKPDGLYIANLERWRKELRK